MHSLAGSASVDAYLAAQPPKARTTLTKIRALTRKLAPVGEEGISYGIPTVRLKGKVLVHFAGFKEHVSMFPPVRDAALLKRLKEYAGPKGNLKFPLDRPIPYPLIREVVGWHLERLGPAATTKAPVRAAAKKPAKSPNRKTPAKKPARRESRPR